MVPEVTIMRPLAALAAAGLFLAPSLALACDEEETDGSTPFETRIVVREGAWLDSELDSAWSALEPGTFLLRLKRPTGAWVAEYWFFRLAGLPGQAFPFEEMTAMEREGTIDDTTESGLIVYQVLLYAQDGAQAARLATAMRPRAVPPRVAEALAPGVDSTWH
jgi:hypothetical protein